MDASLRGGKLEAPGDPSQLLRMGPASSGRARGSWLILTFHLLEFVGLGGWWGYWLSWCKLDSQGFFIIESLSRGPAILVAPGYAREGRRLKGDSQSYVS